MEFTKDNIEKIYNDLYKPTANLTLRHGVKLASMTNKENKKREIYHKEFIYTSRVYSDMNKLITIKLTFMSFFTLELSKSKKGDLRFVPFIGMHNINTLLRIMEEISNWIYKPDSYYIKNRELNISHSHEDIFRYIDLGQVKTKFQPTITVRGEERYEGVRISFNGDNIYEDLTIDEFENLRFILKQTNLYIAGLAILDYIGFPRAKIGTDNSIEMSNYSNMENNQGGAKTTMIGRKIGDNVSEKSLLD